MTRRQGEAMMIFFVRETSRCQLPRSTLAPPALRGPDHIARPLDWEKMTRGNPDHIARPLHESRATSTILS